MSVHYYPLINKVFNSLNIRDQVFAKGQSSREFDSAFKRPFITVAREPGSGGAPIAKLIAKKLGFTFVNEQIVEEVASSIKQRKAVIQAVDEKNRSRIEDLVHSALNSEYVDDVTYVTEMTKVILTYAHKGHVVILGRGANFICPLAMGLHVNITAPTSTRIQRAMDFEGFNETEARKVITKTEKERQEFVKQYFKKDLTKCNSYDLTLNTAYFNVPEAADVVIETFYRKFPRSTRYTALFKK